jgi:hypothetical protein
MRLKDMRQNYVFCAEIDLGDGEFVRLRELAVTELNDLNKVAQENQVDEMSKLFPKCLVAHSFTNEDGSPASNEDVYKQLRDSGSLFVEIITTWIASLPFNSRLKKEPK